MADSKEPCNRAATVAGHSVTCTLEQGHADPAHHDGRTYRRWFEDLED